MTRWEKCRIRRNTTIIVSVIMLICNIIFVNVTSNLNIEANTILGWFTFFMFFSVIISVFTWFYETEKFSL